MARICHVDLDHNRPAKKKVKLFGEKEYFIRFSKIIGLAGIIFCYKLNGERLSPTCGGPIRIHELDKEKLLKHLYQEAA